MAPLVAAVAIWAAPFLVLSALVVSWRIMRGVGSAGGSGPMGDFAREMAQAASAVIDAISFGVGAYLPVLAAIYLGVHAWRYRASPA